MFCLNNDSIEGIVGEDGELILASNQKCENTGNKTLTVPNNNFTNNQIVVRAEIHAEKTLIEENISKKLQDLEK